LGDGKTINHGQVRTGSATDSSHELGYIGFRAGDDFNVDLDARIFLTESFGRFLISSLFVGIKR
jgi:hypothetical protein